MKSPNNPLFVKATNNSLGPNSINIICTFHLIMFTTLEKKMQYKRKENVTQAEEKLEARVKEENERTETNEYRLGIRARGIS